MKRVEILLDPPRGVVPDGEHDYVTVTAEASDGRLLKWFLDQVRNITACQYDIEDVPGEPECLNVIPGTFIACGEGENYCRPACRKEANMNEFKPIGHPYTCRDCGHKGLSSTPGRDVCAACLSSRG